MTLTIQWADPPDQRRNNPTGDELDQAAALIERPGHWALIWTDVKTTTAKSRATALRQRDSRIRCRVVTHDATGKATADLYARIPVPAAGLAVAS